MKDSSTDIFNQSGFLFMLYNQENSHNNLRFLYSDDKTYKVDYKINNYNYRDSKDITPNNPADILAVGCSNTFGVGVPQEYMWSTTIEKITGLSVANLGVRGASAEQIVSNVINYIDTIGKPKYVFAFMPDFLRYYHVVDNKFYIDFKDPVMTDGHKSYITTSRLKTMDYETGSIYRKDPIVKFPAQAEYVVSPEEGLKQYIMSMYNLQAICNIANIKFYWSTWNDLAEKLLTEKLFHQENFYIKKEHYIIYNRGILCDSPCNHHIEHQCDYSCFNKYNLTIQEEHKVMWDTAADLAHMGIHGHFHVADMFIQKI